MSWFRKAKKQQLDFDEVLVDSGNLPSFNRGRLEGRLETPLGRFNIFSVGILFSIVALVFLAQLFRLQIVEGGLYATQSENNRLDKTVLIADRGVMNDRTGEPLVWNAEGAESDFSRRLYSTRRGIGSLLGYVSYPKKDTSGFYFRTEYIGRGGVEEGFNSALQGQNGEQLSEVDALGHLVSAHIVHASVEGASLTLSIDARLSEALYDVVATTTTTRGFRTGVAAMMDVETGEIIAVASYPDFDPNVMASGEDSSLIASYNADVRLPFLNKVISGVYTPGSIVKPFMALTALKEHIVSPEKTFVSTGKLVVPNPYNPDNPSVFTDWKAHGVVDMRRAIAVSSNVYFYIVGGGFGDQKGIGITKIHDAMVHWGLGSTTNVGIPGEVAGVVPSPAWKAENFEDGTWRLGDTYLTAIGQFGFQVTPLAMLRAFAAIANGGKLVTPTILKDAQGATTDLGLNPADRQVVIEGMRGAALFGTAQALNMKDVEFAAKSGTAELGASKAFVNSWVTGFYPYQKPKYAFIMLMEHGPRANLFGSSGAFSTFVSWMRENTPEYLYVNQPNPPEKTSRLTSPSTHV